MSFPKAKIIRFNDIVSTAPPPGQYDPKINDKVKGFHAVIDKSKRFTEASKLAGASSMEFLSVPGCSHMHSVFRTPQQPPVRKSLSTSKLPVKFNHSCEKSKKKLTYKSDDDSNIHPLNGLDQLKLASNFIEKNDEIVQLQDRVQQLTNQIVELEQSHLAQIETLRSRYEEGEEELKQDVAHKLEQAVQAIANMKTWFDLVFGALTSIRVALDECFLNYEQTCSMYSQCGCAESAHNQLESEALTELWLAYKVDISTLSLHISQLIELAEGMNKACTHYEVVQRDSAHTIEALSQRLLESDVELERVTSLVEQVTAEKQELQAKVEEQTKAVQEEIEAVTQGLMDKLESYKKFSEEQIPKYEYALQEKQQAIEVMLEELDFSRNKVLSLEEFAAECQSKATVLKEQYIEYQKSSEQEKENLIEKLSSQIALNSHLTADYEEAKKKLLLDKDRLSQQLSELELAKNTLEEEKSLKVHEVESLKQSIEELKQDQTNQNQKMTDLEQQLGLAQETIELLNQEISGLVESVNNKQQELAQLQAIETGLRQQISLMAVELEDSKTYGQSVTDHMVSLINTIGEKDKEIETLTTDLDMKTTTLHQVSDEYEKMKELMESERSRANQLQTELSSTQLECVATCKYVDEVISDLVLEKERCVELSTALQVAKDEKTALLDDTEQLKEKQNNKISELEQIVTEKSQEYDRVNQQLEDKINEVQQIVSHYEELLKDTSNKADELKIEQEAQINALQQTNEVLSDELTTAVNDLQSLGVEMKEVESQRLDALTRVSQLEEQLDSTQIELSSAQQQLVELSATLQVVKDEKTVLLENNEQQINKISELEQLITEKNQECNQISQELEHKANELQQIVTHYEELLTDTEGRASKLKKEQEDQINDLVQANRVLSEELTATVNNLNNLTVEIKEVESQRSTALSRVSQLEEQLNSTQTQLTTLQQQLQFKTKQLEDYDSTTKHYTHQIDSLKQTIEKNQGEIQQLTEDYSKKISELKEIRNSLTKDVEYLQEEFERQFNNNKQLTSTNNDLEKIINDLNSELVSVKEQLAGDKQIWNQQQFDLEETNNKLESEVDDLKAELASALEAFTSVQKEKENYKSLCGELEQSTASLESKINYLIEQNQQLLSEKSNSQELNSLKAELSKLQSKNQELSCMIGPMKDILASVEAQKKKLQLDYEVAKKELHELRLEQAEIFGHQNIKQKIRRMVQMTEELNEAKKELDRLRAENVKLKQMSLTSSNRSSFRRSHNKENPTPINISDKVTDKVHETRAPLSPANARKDRI